MADIGESIRDRAYEWWWLDAPVVVAGTVAAARVVAPGTGIDILGGVDLATRREAYGDLITITSLVAGFSTLAFTIYLGWSSRKVSTVKRIAGPRLLAMWLGLIGTPWICSLVVWVSKVMDRGDEPTNLARWAAVGAMVLALLSVMRSVLMFAQLAGLESSPRQEATRPTSPRPISRKRDAA
jgi:hypothetical protein